MGEFYDPYLYDLNVGPGSRVSSMYLAEAEQGTGPVLELGCGTGDVLLPIARAGLEVVGLDSSNAMLNRCRELVNLEPPSIAERIELVEGQMESFSLSRRFQRIIITNDGIAHLLDEQSLRKTLESCRRHLIPGGKLTLDIAFFDVQYLGRFVGREREVLRDRGCFPLKDGTYVQVWEQTQYDQDAGILTAMFRYEFLDVSQNVMKTYYRRLLLCPRRPFEVALALEAGGFEDIKVDRIAEEEKAGWILRASRD